MHVDRDEGRQAPSAAISERYRWIAMGVVLIGTFMVILDTTIVNVALPKVGDELGQARALDWVVTGYLLAVGVAQPATGWLADRFGRKSVFAVSLGLFALGSLLASGAPTLPALVAFRVLQGLGGGAMMPVGLAIVYELFPPERRGQALGIWGIAAMAAPTIGPVLGGWLVVTFNWRSIFLVNVPIGAVGVAAALWLLRDVGYRERRRLDLLGLVFAAGGLVALLVALAQARDWGWSGPATLVLLIGGAALIGAFVWHAARIDHPIVDVAMFAVRTFSLTIAIMLLVTTAGYSRLVFVPLELESLRGLTALQTGFVLAPGALGAAVTMPLGGRLADRIGARAPVLAGCGLIVGALWLFGRLTMQTPVSYIVGMMVVYGLGLGLALMPNIVAGLNALPHRFVAQASAVQSLTRQIAASLGIAVLSTAVAAEIGSISASGLPPTQHPAAQTAYNHVFLIAMGGMLAATALSLFLPDRHAMRRLQEERRAEQTEEDTEDSTAPRQRWRPDPARVVRKLRRGIDVT